MRTPLQGIMREWHTRSVFRLLALILCFVLVAEVPLGQLLATVSRRNAVPGRAFAQTLPMPQSDGLTANPDIEAALWVAKETVLKLAADSGTRLLDLPDVINARAVAVDEALRVLWAFGSQTLYAYHVDGTLLHQLAIPSPSDPGEGDERVPLVVNPRNDTVWLGQHRDLHALSADGVRQFTVHMQYPIQGLAVVPQAAWVWVATQRQVLAYDETGTERQRLLLGQPPWWKIWPYAVPPPASCGWRSKTPCNGMPPMALYSFTCRSRASNSWPAMARGTSGPPRTAVSCSWVSTASASRSVPTSAGASSSAVWWLIRAISRVGRQPPHGLAYRHGRAHRAHHYPAPSPAHP